MNTEKLTISSSSSRIPALLISNDKCEGLYISVHGLMSSKSDTVEMIFAEEALKKGHAVLSIDLPEHGERKDEVRLYPWVCVSELNSVYDFAAARTDKIGLFACSIGAYMSMLAYWGKAISQALFLSPVADMNYLINCMMASSGVSEERLKAEGIIPLPNGQVLDYDYLEYVRRHPVAWKHKTAVMHGKSDFIIPSDVINSFGNTSGAEITEIDSEHFFHTEKALSALRVWFSENID